MIKDFVTYLWENYLWRKTGRVDFNGKYVCECGYEFGKKDPTGQICPKCNRMLFYKRSQSECSVVDVEVKGPRSCVITINNLDGENDMIIGIKQDLNFAIDLDSDKKSTFRRGNRVASFDGKSVLYDDENAKRILDTIKQNCPDIFYRTGLKEYLEAYPMPEHGKLMLLFDYFEFYTKLPHHKSIELLLKAGFQNMAVGYIPYSKYNEFPKFMSLKELFPIPKNILKTIRREIDPKLTCRIYERIEDIIAICKYCSITEDDAVWIYRNGIGYHLKNNLQMLLGDERYNFTALRNYIEQENNLDYHNISLLVDYVRMAKQIGIRYEKYPKDLKKKHDEVMKAYKLVENSKLEKNFIAVMAKQSHLLLEDENFIVVLPQSPQDLVREGAAQHHCVSSYVSKVANGQSVIVFIRKKEQPEKAYITVELVNNTPVQIRGFSNSIITEEDALKFIKKWERHISKTPLKKAS